MVPLKSCQLSGTEDYANSVDSMPKRPATTVGGARAITILCVDPIEEDHATLKAIFGSSPWSVYPDCVWTLASSTDLRSAWRLLRTHRFPLVLCECDLRQGTWRELLDLLKLLPEPPFLIVTSRAADERLWAEALNLGAYDVLAKPFDRTEVSRILSLAWMHWSEQHSALEQARVAIAGGPV